MALIYLPGYTFWLLGGEMGFRFRRTWGIIPGVRLNLGMKSGSVSFGMRGFHYTVGTQGRRVTVGLPGTGLFWTKKIGSSVSPPPVQPNQPQSNFPLAGRVTTPLQSPPPQTPLRPMGSGALPPPPNQTHIFVPLWFVWSALTVIVIAGSCAVAAIVGGRTTVPTIKSQFSRLVVLSALEIVSDQTRVKQE
jgi:hypothetical protein